MWVAFGWHLGGIGCPISTTSGANQRTHPARPPAPIRLFCKWAGVVFIAWAGCFFSSSIWPVLLLSIDCGSGKARCGVHCLRTELAVVESASTSWDVYYTDVLPTRSKWATCTNTAPCAPWGVNILRMRVRTIFHFFRQISPQKIIIIMPLFILHINRALGAPWAAGALGGRWGARGAGRV